MFQKPVWQITTKSPQSVADPATHHVRLIWRQWQIQTSICCSKSQRDDETSTFTQSRAKDKWTLTSDILLTDTNTKINGPSLGPHTKSIHSPSHAPTNTSTQTSDVSMCLQDWLQTPHFFFLAGAETDYSKEAVEVLNQLSWAGTAAEPLPRPETVNKRVLWNRDHHR